MREYENDLKEAIIPLTVLVGIIFIVTLAFMGAFQPPKYIITIDGRRFFTNDYTRHGDAVEFYNVYSSGRVSAKSKSIIIERNR